ncbi:MAG: DUF2191 domain-containing protein [Verrucomicrobia bacterium]|nr:DUF2191 domain-containing protein [Verrucomicrobiota bacterium]
MRTTLTLDDDVAALLARTQKARKAAQKTIVNEGLRHGLKQLLAPAQRRKRFATKPVELGRCLAGNLDDVAEVLAVAEGENFQ